jgi:dihydrofolate reductase
MRRVTVFNFVTLDGFFKGPNGDIRWHRHGAEEGDYAAEGLRSGATLLFGRVTYEMMAGYWPTPTAMENAPVVAAGMNQADKIVFSRTLKKTEWQNTRILSGNIVDQIRKMKQMPGKDMTLLGSGTIVAQFAEEGLIDEYQIMVDPVALGRGTPIFNGIKHKLDFKLTMTRPFKSGVVLLCYQPVEKV